MNVYNLCCKTNFVKKTKFIDKKFHKSYLGLNQIYLFQNLTTFWPSIAKKQAKKIFFDKNFKFVIS